MGNFSTDIKFVSPPTRTLHPSTVGTNLTLSGTVSSTAGTVSGSLGVGNDITVVDDVVIGGGLSVGNAENALAGQIKLGLTAGSGYLTFYDGAYLPGHVDGSEILFDISGTEALKLLSTGHLRIKNNKLFKSLNAAGNADLDLIGRNASDALVLGSGLTGLVKASSSVITAATLVDADVNAAAAIQTSKLDVNKFGYYRNATVANVTGDGTVYTCPFNTAIDTSADYATGTGIYTVPTGRGGTYLFKIVVTLNGLAAGHNDFAVTLVTTGATFYIGSGNAGAMRSVGNAYIATGVVQAVMAAGDTARVQLSVGGSTKVVGFGGDGTLRLSYFSGERIN